jgi:hypothetical protein
MKKLPMKKLPMKKLLSGQTFIIAAAALLIGPAAHADQTVKMTMLSSTTTVNGKHLTPNDARIRKGLLEPSGRLEATIYSSGNKIKCVSPTMVTIRDLGSTTQTCLLPETKSKFVMSVLPPASTMKQWNHNRVVNFIDMKETGTLIGHKVRLFKIDEKSAMMRATAYIWVAPDIPSPPASFVGNSALDIPFRGKIAGTMLKESIVTVIPRYRVKIAAVYEVTALSSAPIPASTFTIPNNYTTVLMPGLYAPKPAHSPRKIAAMALPD